MRQIRRFAATKKAAFSVSAFLAALLSGCSFLPWARAENVDSLTRVSMEITGSTAIPGFVLIAVIPLLMVVVAGLLPATLARMASFAAIVPLFVLIVLSMSVKQTLPNRIGATLAGSSGRTSVDYFALDYTLAPALTITCATVYVLWCLWVGFTSRNWPVRRNASNTDNSVDSEEGSRSEWEMLQAGIDPSA